jgi:ketosteroid isomerase-like protein
MTLTLGRLKGSETEMRQRFPQVYTIRAGKVCHIMQYLDRAEALKAVGLE